MRRLGLLLLSGIFIGLAGGCAMLVDAPPIETREKYKTPSELYEKAMDAFQSGKYARARDLLHEYIGQYPESLTFKPALYDLAHCYQILGDDKEAMALYNRLVTTYGDKDFWGEQAMMRIKQIKGEQ